MDDRTSFEEWARARQHTLVRAAFLVTGRGLPCPASERVTTDVDYMGPGQSTPAQAVALSTEGQMVTEVVGREGLVHVLRDSGTVRRTYRVTEQSDGWWYDAYVECRS